MGDKINEYLIGTWSNYRFHDNGEYARVFLLLIFIFFIYYVIQILKRSYYETFDPSMVKYFNFISFYFCFGIIFLGFRTISTRLILDGFVFFIPLIYYFFKVYKFNFNRLLSLFIFFIWILLFDFKILNIYNNSYMLGSGFPQNLFESPIFPTY